MSRFKAEQQQHLPSSSMAKVRDSIAQHYHERTKYDPETIAAKSQGLNWATQPSPFKEYKIGAQFDLKPYLEEDAQAQLLGDRLFWQRLSRLLLCSYGLTARLPTMMGDDLYLRAAPSAGGLYPAEVYLISRGTPQLPAGLYNFQAKTHSLVQFWTKDIWQDLQAACFWHPALASTELALVVTAVFYRSAWRYQDRAYRRIFLDAGHLLGNLELAGSMAGYRPHLMGGFLDATVNELLYLDAEQEGAIAVIALADLLNSEQHMPPLITALPSATQTSYPRIPDGQLLTYFHQATEITSKLDLAAQEQLLASSEPSVKSIEDKYNFPFCLKVSTSTMPVNWSDRDADEQPLQALESTILRRRSTRAYSGANLTLEELKAVLDFTYQPQHYTNQELDGAPDYFDLSLIETFVTVSGVDGLEEGCYYYAPLAQELRQIRFKNFRRELHYLCLGQDLGRDAAALIFHTADLQTAVGKYGDRAYRYLHMDAGHLGQRINLASIRLGLGVSGIGGFFDNQVNEVLGIPADEAVLYITTLGRPR